MKIKNYTHLSRFERGRIFQWHHYERLSIREIGRRLTRSHTSISRELRRNINYVYVPTYYPNIAENKAKYRLSKRARRYRLKDKLTRKYIIKRLKLGWSPEIISGRLSLKKKFNNVSHEAIYQFIYQESPKLIEFLPRKHKKRKIKYPKRKQYSKIKEKVMITERPDFINERKEYGHWESDSIESSGRDCGLNVLVERKSRLTHITKLKSKKSLDTKEAIESSLSQHNKTFVKTITYDNGSENARHLETNNFFNIKSYFCLAYHSWEKGAVEQVNGLIRRYIPKKSDISKITEEELFIIEKLLNNRPRKCLNYKTPYEVYEQQNGALLC